MIKKQLHIRPSLNRHRSKQGTLSYTTTAILVLQPPSLRLLANWLNLDSLIRYFLDVAFFLFVIFGATLNRPVTTMNSCWETGMFAIIRDWSPNESSVRCACRL